MSTIGPKRGGMAGAGPSVAGQGSSAGTATGADETKLHKELEALVELEKVAFGTRDQFSPAKYGLGQASGSGVNASSRDNPLSALAANPAMLERALRLAYNNTGDPARPSASRDHYPPQISPQSSHTISQIRNALAAFNSQGKSPDAQAQTQGFANLSDYLNSSALPYASKLLNPPQQRLLQAQLLGDPSRAPAGSPRAKSAPMASLRQSTGPSKARTTSAAATASAASSATSSASSAISSASAAASSLPPSVQAALQSADDAYQKGDYDTAFSGYQSALNADPQLAQSWPTILYQLGACAESSKVAATQAQAVGYYQQYASSSGADPKTVAWVNNEIPWLKVAPSANAAVQKAQDEMWKENNPYNALSGLQAAVSKYPELTQKTPDVYYYLALYAYSSADVPDAKKYIAQAQQAMSAQDPSSSYAQYYNTQISQLSQQIGTFNASTWTSDKIRGALSSVLGNGRAAQQIGQELGNGMTNWWIPMTSTRGAHNLWEASSDASWHSGDPTRGLITTSSHSQKQALNVLDNKVDAAQAALKKNPNDKAAADDLEAAQSQRTALAGAKDKTSADTLANKIIADEEATLKAAKAPQASSTSSEATPGEPITSGGPVTPGGPITSGEPVTPGEPTSSPRSVSPLASNAAGSAESSVEFKQSELDSSELGPGWWGLGTTLANEQAAGGQWYLGQDKNGAIQSDWRGPFATTSKYDPSSQGVTLAKGGTGLGQYWVGATASANVANEEARAYDMVYGGGSVINSVQGGGGLQGALGFGGVLGAQARADYLDLEGGVNYAGGSATIGGAQLNNLVTANANASASVGSQADASISFGASPTQASIGESLGAFSGAQATGSVGGSIDGVGAQVIGQAWAGFGAKENLSLSYAKGKATFDLGLGAALGYGGFLDIAGTVNFNQVLDAIRGVGGDAKQLSKRWGKSAGEAGTVAGAAVGGTEGALAFGGDSLFAAGNAIESLDKTIDKKTGIIGAVGTINLKQFAETLEAPKQFVDEINKNPSQAFGDATKAIKKGGIVSATTDAVAGGTKWVGKKLVGLFK